MAVLGLLGWGAYAYYWPTGNATMTDITAPAARGDLLVLVTERGELESSKTEEARCEVEGRQIKIIEIVPEGSQVTKGQVVVRFDTEELTRNYAEQEIKLKQAEGKAKAAKEELEVQKNKAAGDTAKAELALELAVLERDKYFGNEAQGFKGEYQVEEDDRKGAIALARRDLDEAVEKLNYYQTFVKKGFGTPEQLKLKEADVEQKRYLLNRDEAKLMVLQKITRYKQEKELNGKAQEAERELARSKGSGAAAIAKGDSELEAAQITAKLEKTALERLKKQLDNCTVKAPQDGILLYDKRYYWDTASRIQPGAVVHYQQPLISIPDLTRMQVKVKIHESMVKKIAKGQPVEIRIEAYPKKVLHGKVENVATLADSQGPWDERGVKEYVTMVTIDDLPADAGLKPGMTAEVQVRVAHYSKVLLVPVQAVCERDGQHFAYVAGPQGIERRVVTIGDNNEKFIEVKTGLAEGDRVALNARARLTAEAKAKEEAAAASSPVPPTPTTTTTTEAPKAK